MRDSGAIGYKSGNLFKYNGLSWSIIEGTGGGGGGTDYVNAGWGVEVDSVGRNYTVKVDSNAIKGVLLKAQAAGGGECGAGRRDAGAL